MGCIESRYSRLKYLSGENLEFLKANTGYDEATIKESHEIFIKECPNGNLTPDKLIDLYTPFIAKGKAEQYCNHVFRTFDTDKNGFIDFKEFLLAVYITSDGTAKQKLESAFRMYDVDGNGVIDQDEMANVMQAIYGMMGEGAKNPGYWADERAKCIFIQMDENFDGHITEDEFLRGCLQDEELSKMLVV